MEEQPKGRAQERRYHHHGEERTPIQLKTSLKNEQIHFQHQETQTKKTGNGKINTIDVGGGRTLSPDDTAAPYAIATNGSRHLINATSRQKSTQKVYSTASKVVSKDCLDQTMNISDDNASDFNHYDGQELDKKESVLLQNGVVNSVYITNGFSSKSVPDDGSGSEGGYTTPKKRKARRNSIKNTENVTRERERAMQQGNAIHEPEAEPTETVLSLRFDSMKSVHKAEAHTAPRRTGAPEAAKGEPQRKNSDSKTAGASGKKFEDRPKAKMSSSTKEDSWTLFKPPPVFPVDNSSAKIVPKISYASKVKENLNKAAQSGAEPAPPQAPARLSQVPMSAMKTITSASFTNGPVSGDGNGCPSGGTFFASAASSIPPAPSLPCGENVASPVDNNCSSTNNPVAAAFEMRKCTLFIPVNPLNMQPVLPSARQVDNPAAQTNQKALGDIFQNQWGLSFINEPNVGPDGGSGQPTVEEEATPVTFQAECTVVADQSCLDASSPVPEPLTLAQEKRTSTPSGTSLAHIPALTKDEEEAQAHLPGQEKTKGEAKSPGATAAAPCKDSAAEPTKTSLTNLALGVSKEQTLAQSKNLDRRCSWGSFDLKAAVNYHTKEMGYIFNLQKQDPKRVVVYDETQDGPDQ